MTISSFLILLRKIIIKKTRKIYYLLKSFVTLEVSKTRANDLKENLAVVKNEIKVSGGIKMEEILEQIKYILNSEASIIIENEDRRQKI